LWMVRENGTIWNLY